MIPVFRRIKSVMLADIEDWHGQRLFIAATMDDAQYKAKLFDDDQKECAKAMHTEQVNGVIANRTPDNTMTTVPRNNNASFSMNCGNKAWHQLLSQFVMQPLIMTRQVWLYTEQPKIAQSECPMTWCGADVTTCADVEVVA